MKNLFISIMALSGVLCAEAFGQSGGAIIAPGTAVTIESGTTLDISNGYLLLQDDYSHAPSFLQKGTVQFTGSGEAQAELYLPKDVWHIVSSPVQNEVNGAFLWIYLAEFLEPTNTWHYLNKPLNIPLDPGQGYYCWSYTSDPNGTYPASPDSVVYNGTLNHQDVNLTMTVTAASIKSGWNLVGNPFPCAIDWNGHTDWNLTNLDATVWVLDPVAGNFKIWNYNSGGTLNSGEIASGQGFWVHATDTVTSTTSSFTLPASQRVHSDNPFYKSGGPMLANQLKLMVQGNGPENDETIIGFSENASPGFSPVYDARYLEGGNELAPMLFSVVSANSYALKLLPDWEQFPAIPVNFIANVPGNYTISASWIENFPEDLPVFLEDKKENHFHNFRLQPEYVFINDLNENPDRFMVHFTNPLGVNNPEDVQGLNIYSWNQTVYIQIPEHSMNEGQCIIYDMMGQKVIAAQVFQGLNTVSFPFNTGHYIVTVNTGTGKMITDKVYIK